MNSSEILAKLNDQNSLDNLIRLADIETEHQAAELSAQGYYIGFTKERWEEECPELNVGNMYVPKSVLFPAGLVYYDADKYLYISMPFYDEDSLAVFPNMKSMVVRLLHDKEQQYQERDYVHLLFDGNSEQSGNVAAELLNNIIRNERISTKLYDAFISYYSFCDCGASKLEPPSVLKIKHGKTEAQKKRTFEKMKSLPEEITIYRGQGSKSTPYTQAYSWATDIQTAFFFAARHGSEESMIAQAKINKHDIIEYISSRGEFEVIAHPDDVYEVEVQECVSLEFFRTVITARLDHLTDDDEIPYSLDVSNIMDEVSSIFADRASEQSDHDAAHTKRVILLANYMYRQKLASCGNDEGDINRHLALFKKLMEAASHHDIGRDDDGIDETHGERSYEIYQEMYGCDDKIVKFLISYHCINDDEARKAWQIEFAESPDKDEIWYLFCVLKDADALDRCRFGIKALDIKLLRLDESKLLIPIATKLQEYRY